MQDETIPPGVQMRELLVKTVELSWNRKEAERIRRELAHLSKARTMTLTATPTNGNYLGPIDCLLSMQVLFVLYICCYYIIHVSYNDVCQCQF